MDDNIQISGTRRIYKNNKLVKDFTFLTPTLSPWTSELEDQRGLSEMDVGPRKSVLLSWFECVNWCE